MVVEDGRVHSEDGWLEVMLLCYGKSVAKHTSTRQLNGHFSFYRANTCILQGNSDCAQRGSPNYTCMHTHDSAIFWLSYIKYACYITDMNSNSYLYLSTDIVQSSNKMLQNFSPRILFTYITFSSHEFFLQPILCKHICPTCDGPWYNFEDADELGGCLWCSISIHILVETAVSFKHMIQRNTQVLCTRSN